jgi:transcriptional regulator with XRE-family HTH domain
MKLGMALKVIRTASGIKQKDIAAKLGVTPNYISLLEGGRREPSISFLKKLAKILKVPIGLLLLWDEAEGKNFTKEFKEVRNLLTELEAVYLRSTRNQS